MKYMLDTNICIYAIKKNPDSVLNHLMDHDPGDICISSVSFSELCYGVEKSRQVERNRIALTMLLSNIEIVSYDAKAAYEYGKIRTQLEIQGSPIGSMDMLIAAHALSCGYTLVTNNTKEFNRVENLLVENWV